MRFTQRRTEGPGRARAAEIISEPGESNQVFNPDDYISAEAKAALFESLDRQLAALDPETPLEDSMFAGIGEAHALLGEGATLAILYPEAVSARRVIDRTQEELSRYLGEALEEAVRLQGGRYVSAYAQMLLIDSKARQLIPVDQSGVDSAVTKLTRDGFGDNWGTFCSRVSELSLIVPSLRELWDKPSQVTPGIKEARELMTAGENGYAVQILGAMAVAFPKEWVENSEIKRLRADLIETEASWLGGVGKDFLPSALAYWKIVRADRVEVTVEGGLRLIYNKEEAVSPPLPARNKT
ncbi:MAG: hypothetical protein COW24_03260 [Candidatus Kerfeldbacteria bacterium CG15_BIG_FIL_POST_REV_8_21_14_020_45_12]|uniref:Uncharacterized protein n=1 Tax=Candidatus Kerfeldbacteria bacterium CG15_BIG_FIL_POST_REV_8_21_14_020_45_12 TaxID=2014247 RepID=A0A2M7H3N2_9BACT|nr:MAG: hypothetical protein COW24_03260 [Candidatus Kerfeldbacteria bacterium CG15_BIG_FIL_POST_REV_8_21_14_020_45_12]PJA93450.1 MAG: hypothetical protein CO132_03065 [Candidatus Kerfeldbacteria bacterium CG_4_9_14_3_um_filter_45_8]